MSITRDFEQLKSNISIMTFLNLYLPDGVVKGNEWISINPTRSDNKKGSFKVNIINGVWCDFATNDKGGDIIDLLAYLKGISLIDAYDLLADDFQVHNFPVANQKTENNDDGVIIYPVPYDAPEFDGSNYHYVFSYKDHEQKRLTYVTRMHDGANKRIIQWTYRRFNDGTCRWHSKGPKGHVKPIYRLQELLDKPDARVLIVEGEKTADAASRLLPDWCCITWFGGGNCSDKLDKTFLKNRDIVLWPDNDSPGNEAMQALKKILVPIAKEVKVIKMEWLVNKRQKWDLEDAEKEGATTDDILFLIHKLDEIKEIGEFPLLSQKGNILNLPENIEHLINFYGCSVRFNEISKRITSYIPHSDFSKTNKEELILIEIMKLCIIHNVPKAELGSWILYIADKYRYNPVKEWIQSKPWDGISRFKEFSDTLQCVDNNLRDVLLKTWMVGAISVAYDDRGRALHGVLTLLGETSLGKSSWIKALLPPELDLMVTDFSLNPNDKDSVMQATSNWLTELSEVDAMVRKSDVASVKAFLTRDVDIYRAPYGRTETRAPRRTAFLASVNDPNFLRDTTGNRRWWVLQTLSVNYEHSIDMQQVWSEIEDLYFKRHPTYLNREQEVLLNTSNKEYMAINAIHEKMLSKLDFSVSENAWDWMTTTEILEILGYLKPTDKDIKDATAAIKQLNLKKGDPKIRSKMYLKLVPPLRKEAVREVLNNFL